MVEKKPKVSIGLPVYNGEQFLEGAINSILSQTFTDFELIISDNASTDKTREICQIFMAKDPRIHYSRNDTNLGGGNNTNHTFYLSKGKYFCWASHDDLYAPQYLEKCVGVLVQDPAIVLCHTMVTEIDEYGRFLRIIDRQEGSSLKPHERFSALASLEHHCEQTSGLIRSNVLHKTSLLLNYTDADRTLLAELALYGQFHQIAEPLFFKRIHPKMSTLAFPDWHERMAWFNPGINKRIVFPHWQQFFHYMWIIMKSPINGTERLECLKYMSRWILREWHGRWMARDLKIAVKKILKYPTKY
jgi:glycosyltransferase involved in cell wall biosynthesis